MSGSLLLFILIPIVVAGIVGGIKAMSSQSQVNDLNAKFISLGNLKGKTYEEIVEIVGPPKSNSVAGNTRVCVWMTDIAAGAPTYTVSLVFRNGLCESLSEHSTAA